MTPFQDVLSADEQHQHSRKQTTTALITRTAHSHALFAVRQNTLLNTKPKPADDDRINPARPSSRLCPLNFR